MRRSDAPRRPLSHPVLPPSRPVCQYVYKDPMIRVRAGIRTISFAPLLHVGLVSLIDSTAIPALSLHAGCRARVRRRSLALSLSRARARFLFLSSSLTVPRRTNTSTEYGSA